MTTSSFDLARLTYQKLHNGYAISDEEIETTISVFELMLSFFENDRFYLIRKEIQSDLSTLLSYKHARENR